MTSASELSGSLKIDSKYRKIYRAMIEKGNKLDEIYKSQNSFLKLFSSETTLQREKLQRYCETLIFKEPIECGKKAEEILWRRVFYEIIHIVKLNKKNLKCNTQIETMYRLHLSSAYGFYNHLILKFQSEFNNIIKLDGLLDFPFLSYEKQAPLNSKYENLLKEVLIRILHKLLICLGDLARYQIEYDPHGCPRLAYKYYQMSLSLLPNNGMPFNQLGTLHGGDNYGCDAAYYYLYCLSCTDPFLNARENLRILFSKNQKRFAEINSSKYLDRDKLADMSLDEVRVKEIKRFLVLFLRIIDYILTSGSSLLSTTTTTNAISNQQLQEMCTLCLQEFNSCLFYRNNRTNSDIQKFKSNENEKLTYLSDELIFKLTVTILMTIEQLKNKKYALNYTNNSCSINYKNASKFYFTAVAFSLVFFSHIVNHSVIRLQESFYSLKNKCKPIFQNSSNLNDDNENESDDENKKSEIENLEVSTKKTEKSPKQEKSIKKKIHLLYGHRRRKHNSDSDTNDSSSSYEEGETRTRKIESETEEEENEENNSDDDFNQRRGGDVSRRNVTKRRKKIIAKFLERENLSETELNFNSDDDLKMKKKSNTYSSSNSSDEDSSKSNSLSSSSSSSTFDSKIKTKKEEKNIVETNSASDSTTKTAITLETNTPTNVNLQENKNEESLFKFDEFNQDLQLYSNQSTSISFKEFSTQLYSRLSLLQDNSASSNPLLNAQKNENILGQPGNCGHDEFIDNEIYKFVLNGRKEVTIPPGFEANEKEVQEIEELGKKLATFQIETDTEMSILNSKENSTDSSINSDNENEEKQKENEENQKTFGKIDQNEHLETSDKKNTTKSTKTFDLKNTRQLVNILQGQALLPTIKIFCDWLLCNKKIIQSISQVSTKMWSKLAVLLNFIPQEKQIANESICENEYVRSLILKSFETKSWNSQPLSEDLLMRSFSALRLEQISLNFDINNLNKLNVAEENILRLCNLRRFGYLIASFSQSQPNSGGTKFFEYNSDKAEFVAPDLISSESIIKEEADENEKEERTNELKHIETEVANATRKNLEKENRRMELMKNMAQLRLEAEISQLESISYNSDDYQWSPYLVIDTGTLCTYLKLLQDISRTNKFIIIIPLIVIDNLDSIKKESKQSREAIRWLENQFKQGNRFLRAQTLNEKVSTNCELNLKKKNIELWRFYQLIECCKFFQQEKLEKLVTLLVINETYEKSAESNSIKEIAEINMIQLQFAQEFFEKWKKSH